MKKQRLIETEKYLAQIKDKIMCLVVCLVALRVT